MAYYIDKDLCASCGMCADECPAEAISFMQDHEYSSAYIDYEKCIECGSCSDICPQKAINYIENIQQ